MPTPHRQDRSRPKSLPAILFAALTASAASFGLIPVAHAQAPSVKMEWFGWSFFRFTSPKGKVILTNPFITGNADAAVKVEAITKADLLLVPDGNRDEIGDTIDIAKNTGAKIVSPFELGTWFSTKGVPDAQLLRRNPGSRLVWEGITIRVVGSVHGSGSGRDTVSDAAPIYGGAAAGFMITFENGWTVYFPGSSAATQDMALCKLTPELMQHVRTVHLRESVEGERMTFDFKLRPGPVRGGNALRLMRSLGLSVPLIEPAAPSTEDPRA